MLGTYYFFLVGGAIVFLSFSNSSVIDIPTNKFDMKEGKNIVPISKDEAMYLISKGIPYGENGISHTTGHHKKYYLTESKKNAQILDRYRKSKISK